MDVALEHGGVGRAAVGGVYEHVGHVVHHSLLVVSVESEVRDVVDFDLSLGYFVVVLVHYVIEFLKT